MAKFYLGNTWSDESKKKLASREEDEHDVPREEHEEALALIAEFRRIAGQLWGRCNPMLSHVCRNCKLIWKIQDL